MKKIILLGLMLTTIMLFTKNFLQLEARPGGGSSYRSSSSRSSSSSYSRSSYSRSSSSHSYSSSGGHYSGGGSSLSNEEAAEIAGLLLGTSVSIIAIVFVTLGLRSNKEEPLPLNERIGYLAAGFSFMLLGAWLASLSKIVVYLYLFLLLILPFAIIIYAIYRLKNGREIIYVAKGEME